MEDCAGKLKLCKCDWKETGNGLLIFFLKKSPLRKRNGPFFGEDFEICFYIYTKFGFSAFSNSRFARSNA